MNNLEKCISPVENRDHYQSENTFLDVHEFPLFDEADGVENAVGSKETLIELLNILTLETIPGEKQSLHIAYTKSDWLLIRKIAHKLKGAALYCGVKRMQMASKYLEQYILAGNSELTIELFDQLIMVLDDTLAYIQNWLAKI